MKTTVYVAGSSREIPRVKAAVARLEAAGLSVPCRWWDAFEAGATNEGLTSRQRLAAATHDYAAIATANVVLVLASEHRSDPRTELGIAIGLNRPRIIVVHPEAHIRGVFAALVEQAVSDEAAVDAIIKEAQT
jgi:GNAT superfamily N-acetyltransferase